MKDFQPTNSNDPFTSLKEGDQSIVIKDKNITSLPAIPAPLKTIALSYCTKLQSVESLAEGIGIEEIVIYSCNMITSLPAIPASVKRIELMNCAQLQSVESFAEGVEQIIIFRCGITSLPAIPDSVNKIDLQGCSQLRQDPKLSQRLLELEEAGCAVGFPHHWNFQEADVAKLRLDRIIEKYTEENPGVPSPQVIKTLFHRFVTEGVGIENRVGDRGGILEVMQSVNPVLEVLEKNPNNIAWAEEVAKAYSGGCVNQPVAGWSELSALAAITKKETIKDKIDASTQLIAFQALNNHIASLPAEQKPGSEVEVEAGNILMREINKRLLKEGIIQEPWLGVPNKVRYEGVIDAGFLREEVREDRISAAYEAVKAAINKTTEEKASYLCEGSHREAWGQIAFPEEIAIIKQEYAQKLEQAPLEELEKLGKAREEVMVIKIKQLTDDAIRPELTLKITSARGVVAASVSEKGASK